MNFRLRHGMFWGRHYPTPSDYRQQLRFVGALFIILACLILAVGYLEYRDLSTQEEEYKRHYRQVLLACLNQARNGGTVGVVVGNEIFGINCAYFGTTENVRM